MADDLQYPTELERDITLKDGTPMRLRPIHSEDAPRLIDFYDRLSRHSAYQRFFSIMKRLPPDWTRIAATVDYRRRLALVAEHAGPAHSRHRRARAEHRERRGRPALRAPRRGLTCRSPRLRVGRGR